MTVRTLLALVAILLAGCFGNLRQAEPAYLDLGLAGIEWRPKDLPLGQVGVSAPDWLISSAIEYRLLYAESQRRWTYAESRWAAPPPYLIERALNRQTPRQGGCRLRLELDNLAQVFDTPQTSRTLLDVRASLIASNRAAVLTSRAFSVARPAPTADARGGAVAAAAAVQALAAELGAWLEQLSLDQPTLAGHCGTG